MQPDEIPCPVCGQFIKLQEHPQFKDKLVAYHNCRPALGMVSVYETDNPAYQPAPANEPLLADESVPPADEPATESEAK